MDASERTRLREICDTIERLDGEASKDWRIGQSVNHPGYNIWCADPRAPGIDVTSPGANMSQADATCAVYYRSLAIEAARGLRHFLSANTEYRAGLPTVEQVRAHVANGGWWMLQDDGEGDPILLQINVEADGNKLFQRRSYSDEWCVFLWDPQRTHSRPTAGDGTPISWTSLDGGQK